MSANKEKLCIIEKLRQNNDINDIFKIYKLNGTTGLYERRGFEGYVYVDDINIPVNLDFITSITERYVQATYFDFVFSSISFAWEPVSAQNNFDENIDRDVADTMALVIIGYSFPFFNREVDRRIINNMKSLRRVYFQSPEPDSLKERFQSLRDDASGIELITKKDVSQFLLPNEL